MELVVASRKKVKLKIGLSGASGFGKTIGALLIAYGITKDWSKIAVVDTENGSASLYAGHTLPNGQEIGLFNTIDLQTPYSPERYIDAIKMCENAGIDVLIIDSITHEWDGEGGCMDIIDQMTKSSKHKNSYISWGNVTPRHKKFVNAILQSKMHVITTVRRKQEYEMTKGSDGKMEVQKIGTKEITREGFEYELSVNLEFQNDAHYVTASKDRTSLFDKKEPFVISVETGEKLIDWAEKGVDEVDFLCNSISNASSRAEATTIWNNNKHMRDNKKVLDAFAEICKLYPKEDKPIQ